MPRGMSAKRARVGKNKDMVQLHSHIPSGQDAYLAKLVQATGREKGQLVSEGIQLLLNEYHKMGVI